MTAGSKCHGDLELDFDREEQGRINCKHVRTRIDHVSRPSWRRYLFPSSIARLSHTPICHRGLNHKWIVMAFVRHAHKLWLKR